MDWFPYDRDHRSERVKSRKYMMKKIEERHDHRGFQSFHYEVVEIKKSQKFFVKFEIDREY